MADAENGLNGEVDFLLSYNTHSVDFNTPLITIVEAKKDELDLGLGQCAAQMYGAKLFNEKEGHALPTIYGCVTNADDWLFLKLENQQIWVDKKSTILVSCLNYWGFGNILLIFIKKK